LSYLPFAKLPHWQLQPMLPLYMRPKVHRLDAAVITIVTLVRLGPVMPSLVAAQRIMVPSSILAHGAGVGLLAGMLAHVHAQVGLARGLKECCGYGMFCTVTCADFYPSRIPDLLSRIQKQQQKRGMKKICCHIFLFRDTNITKFKIILFLNR
jgi:hypothetical protein